MTDPALRVVIAGARAGVELGALARRAGGAAELLRAPGRRLDRWGVPAAMQAELRRARTADVAAYRQELKAGGILCVTEPETTYPPALRDLADPPLAVFLRGALARRMPDMGGPAVAIVGARRPQDASLHLSRRLGAFSAAAGLVVVSGMALGIDAAAHAGALDAGGVTVAVLGCGVDVAYPRSHRGLYERILARGMAVSEYPPGTAPAPWRFPARNRLIAALAGTLVVVEARARSGALITADHALDLGRDVLAVPGSAGSSAAAGTNGLIKSGAGMVEDEADLAGWLGVEPPASVPPPDDAAARGLLDRLAGRPAFADELAVAGLGPGGLGALLSRLEIDGWLARDAAGRYTLARRWTSDGRPSTATAR